MRLVATERLEKMRKDKLHSLFCHGNPVKTSELCRTCSTNGRERYFGGRGYKWKENIRPAF